MSEPNELIERIIDRLMTNGFGERAIRLQLRLPGECNGGGYSEDAIRSILREELEAQRAPAMPEDEALDFEHFWQIVIGWSQDMPRVGQKLSIHEMRTLTERLVSITAASLRSRQGSTAGDCIDCGGPGYHRAGKPGEYDHICARPSPQGEEEALGWCLDELERIRYANGKDWPQVVKARAELAALRSRQSPTHWVRIEERKPTEDDFPIAMASIDPADGDFYAVNAGFRLEQKIGDGSVQGEDALSGIMDFSPSTHTLGAMERGGDYVLKSQVRDALRARLASLDAAKDDQRGCSNCIRFGDSYPECETCRRLPRSDNFEARAALERKEEEREGARDS